METTKYKIKYKKLENMAMSIQRNCMEGEICSPVEIIAKMCKAIYYWSKVEQSRNPEADYNDGRIYDLICAVANGMKDGYICVDVELTKEARKVIDNGISDGKDLEDIMSELNGKM